MTPLLEAKGLSIRIGDRWACTGLDLAIQKGERWGILGINGAGKTSLLLSLCGLREIASGEVRLNGKPFSAMKRREIALIIGMLFQDSEDPFPSTVLDTALTGRHPRSSPWRWESAEDEKIAREALHAVGLSGMEARLANTLSGGERRRLALASLLVQDPDLLLLDEPTNHLDIGHQIGMLDMLGGLGKSLVMVLHDPNLAQRYCDRILLMFDDGEILSGRREEMLNASNLSRLYRHPVSSFESPLGPLFIPDHTAPASGLKTGCL
ncbi:MAG TPA: ABC transporter ATP-binding protein [Burkholderiales bacterium]|nr:ABC transporter ATP-binding protein [Burkholderiales bacterium]